MDIGEVYKKHYKKMILIPIALFLVLLYFLPSLRLGIDFTGGLSISLSSSTTVPPEEIENLIKSEFGVPDVSVIPVSGGYIIEMSYPPELKKVYDLLERWKLGDKEALTELNKIVVIDDVNNIDAAVTAFADRYKEKIISTIKTLLPDASNVVINDIVPILGPEFWNLVTWIAFWAVVLLLVAIMIYFRHPIPVVIMVVSAVFDGIAMLSLMGLTNIPLTLSTIAILLMMVGYSIDTDVIASTYLFKRIKEGNPYKQAERAFLTGITMSLTTLIAMIVIYAVGFLTRNITVIRIANVMIYGVIADMLITWLFNAPLLLWIGEKRASAA